MTGSKNFHKPSHKSSINKNENIISQESQSGNEHNNNIQT